jgi:AraC family transcriptional regulator
MVLPLLPRVNRRSLKAYPRMSFHISIMGGVEMSYRIERLNPFSSVGVKHRVNTDKSFSIIPIIWEETRRNGIPNKFFDLILLSMCRSESPINTLICCL